MNHLLRDQEVVNADTTSVASDYTEFKRLLAEEEEQATRATRAKTTGERIAFSNRHCATDEEADDTHEAFLLKVWDLSDEDA
jgi:hypothetical protein